MNKNDYLKRLSKLLHMLKEDEVKDIVCEYEQHIDMKIEEGMSEEEALAAFGTVEELAREILDAYHVKPDFKEKKSMEVFEKVQSESKKVMKNAGEAGKGFFSNMIEKGKNAISTCNKGMKKTLSFLKKCILAPFVFLKNIFGKKQENKMDLSEKTVKVKKEKTIGSIIFSFLKGIIRFLKKIFYGCFFLFFGSMGVGLLLLLGFMVVLLILGYPVAGVTITILGATMAVNAVAYFTGYRWRKI